MLKYRGSAEDLRLISGSGSEVERSLGVREIAGSIPAFPTI